MRSSAMHVKSPQGSPLRIFEPDTWLSAASPPKAVFKQGPSPKADCRGGLPLEAAFGYALPRREDHALSDWLQRAAAPTEVRPIVLAQPHGAEILRGEEAYSAPHFLQNGRSAWGYDGIELCAETQALRSRSAKLPVVTIKTADCVPVLAVDPVRGVYAALHAGWRGIAAEILLQLLRSWRAEGTALETVRVVLGPHIRSCCYEVGADCLAHFPAALLAEAAQRRAGRWQLSLAQLLYAQARACGLPQAQLRVWTRCSCCFRNAAGQHPYASYRRWLREGGTTPPQTNLSVWAAPQALAALVRSDA